MHLNAASSADSSYQGNPVFKNKGRVKKSYICLARHLFLVLLSPFGQTVDYMRRLRERREGFLSNLFLTHYSV